MRKNLVKTRRTPIYRDAGFVFEALDEAERAFKSESEDPQSSENQIYTRYGNPSVQSAEAAIAELEGSDWALLSSSGMSSIDTALSIFQDSSRRNAWLFLSELYGGTTGYIEEIVRRRRGVEVDWVVPKENRYPLNELREKLIEFRPDVLFLESISNPFLIVPDALGILGVVKEINDSRSESIRVIVDNTFATPLLWRPLEHGVDLVLHSATKYLGGHGDLTAGVICGNDKDLRSSARVYRKLVGSILSPDDAYRLETQLKSFELRFRRQCENASCLASLLKANQGKVARVLYPGLVDHPSGLVARALFKDNGFGAMVTFELRGGHSSCRNFVEEIKSVIPFVPTLGDCDSSLLHVASVFGTERDCAKGMIRLSVGCEPWEEIRGAIVRALERV